MRILRIASSRLLSFEPGVAFFVAIPDGLQGAKRDLLMPGAKQAPQESHGHARCEATQRPAQSRGEGGGSKKSK